MEQYIIKHPSPEKIKLQTGLDFMQFCTNLPDCNFQKELDRNPDHEEVLSFDKTKLTSQPAVRCGLTRGTLHLLPAGAKRPDSVRK
ncbi:hypothetical protein ILYODFUR_028477 [Ilyodon furcidens]|uniref:Uncharacterized protein n=1 Tax=Ilyodon furcidens TaxID=33524 RepID=A0ABV0VHY5_9TELE